MTSLFDQGWNCRKSHVIQHLSGTGSGYPIRIQAHYGNTSNDDGSDVYLHEMCKPDFGDVRFTAADGNTQLDYWMESCNSYNSAVFWVRIAEDLSSTDRTIYIYYGNAEATEASNQFLTGITQVREQQGSTSYSPGISFTIENSTWLKINATQAGYGPGWAFFVVPKAWINGKWLRWSWTGSWDWTPYQWEWGVRIYDGAYLRSVSEDFPVQFEPVSKGAGLLQNPYDITADHNFGPTTYEYQVNVSSAQNDFVTVFLCLRDAWIADWMWGMWDFLEVNGSSGGNDNMGKIDFDTHLDMEHENSNSDYGLIRKYAGSDPAQGEWGSMEPSESQSSTIAVEMDGRYSGEESKKTHIYSECDPIFRVDSNFQNWTRSAIIENLVIEGNGNNTAILLEDVYNCLIRNITFKNCNIGVKITATTGKWAEANKIQHVKMINVNKGVVFDKGNSDGIFHFTHIDNADISLSENESGPTSHVGIEVGTGCILYSPFIKANIGMDTACSGLYTNGTIKHGLINLCIESDQTSTGYGIYIDSGAVTTDNQSFFLAHKNMNAGIQDYSGNNDIRAESFA
jgi:hypothetical protein